MTPDLCSQLAQLGISLLFVLLIWRYYERQTLPETARYDTFGPRFWTGWVDSCVLWPVGFIFSLVLAFHLPKVLAAGLLLTENFVWLIYTVVMHARYGQTVGKMVTKVKVVDCRTEGRISVRQAWLREGIPMLLSIGIMGYEASAVLNGTSTPASIGAGEGFANDKSFWLLTALPGLWFVAEALTMLTNAKSRALHDFIAGTVVVRTNVT